MTLYNEQIIAWLRPFANKLKEYGPLARGSPSPIAYFADARGVGYQVVGRFRSESCL